MSPKPNTRRSNMESPCGPHCQPTCKGEGKGHGLRRRSQNESRSPPSCSRASGPVPHLQVCTDCCVVIPSVSSHLQRLSPTYSSLPSRLFLPSQRHTAPRNPKASPSLPQLSSWQQPFTSAGQLPQGQIQMPSPSSSCKPGLNQHTGNG